MNTGAGPRTPARPDWRRRPFNLQWRGWNKDSDSNWFYFYVFFFFFCFMKIKKKPEASQSFFQSLSLSIPSPPVTLLWSVNQIVLMLSADCSTHRLRMTVWACNYICVVFFFFSPNAWISSFQSCYEPLLTSPYTWVDFIHISSTYNCILHLLFCCYWHNCRDVILSLTF